MREILEKITANDIDVLEQSLAFVRERSALENERGKAAEARATAMLAILGILAGFIVPLIESVHGIVGEIKWSLIVTLFGSLLFLVKGLYHAVRVLGVSKRYRLNIDSVFDFQPLSRVDALREEIAGLIWECKRATQPNTLHLFRLHRCQRSGFAAIILFMLFGILLFTADQQWIHVPRWVAYVIGSTVLLLFFMIDFISEKSGIWGKSHRIAARSSESEAHLS